MDYPFKLISVNIRVFMHFLLHLIYFVKNISVHLCFHGIGWWFQVAERFPSFVREHWETLFTLIQLGRIHVYIYICIAIVGYWKLYISMFNLFLCAIIHHDISWCTKYILYTFYIYISYMSKLTNLYMEDALRPLWLHWMHHVHVKMILGVMFFFSNCLFTMLPSGSCSIYFYIGR